MLVITVLALTANLTMAQSFTYPVQGKQGFSLPEKNRDGMRISYQLGQFSLNPLNYRGEAMSEITISGIALPNNAGSPNLPTESRMMAIPQGAKATLNVVHVDTEVIHNVNIAPALRIQAESEEPDMNYKKDMKVYSRNAYYPENPFVMGESYIRGVDAVTVSITPFQYNPVTKDLLVYTNIELSVSFEGGNGHFGDDRLRSPYWDPILAAELMNYDQLPVIDYAARMQQWLRDGAEGAEYLIVTPNNDAWAPYAQQLKEYRMQQGILTEVIRLDEMPATTTTAMKQWFHNAYSTWEIAPVAVCLLGDHGTNMGQYIPAETTSHPSSGSCITDNMYADPSGDNLPDMVFSRLIAETPDQLPVFVGKQIEYEYSNPNMEPSFYSNTITALGWQTERWFQICSEVFGGYMRQHGYNTNRINCIYSGTPGGSWSSNQNTDMVVNYFGPNGMGYIPATPDELGGWTGGTPDQVVQAVNNGSFWLQHRDHGLETGWGEPAVRNSHVQQMNNVGKLPFVMSINCLTGMFNYNSDCFCEAWMRRTYNGQNAGAVGVLCPTEVSYSFVNDAFVWGVYDLFDGNFMPDYGPFQPAAPQTGNWMPAFGNVAGKYFLHQSSWPYNDDDKDITYTMFTAHCDAFLRIYTQVPETMSVSHQNVQLAGLNTFQITAPEGTTIALTKGEGENLEIVAVATATGSVQNIEIPGQVPPTVLNLTVTGQNYLRYEAAIDVIPADGPYIIIDEYALSNQATQLNYGEDAGLELVLKNVGNTQALGGTVTLTSESEYVTITEGTAVFSPILSNTTTTPSTPFTFSISDEVPNKTPIPFTITITSGDDTYENHITMKAYAPDLKIGNVSIVEVNGNGNGRLDPGETVNLTFPVENKGNADSHVVNAILNLNNVFMQVIGEPTIAMEPIEAGGTENAVYSIYVGSAPSGFPAEYTLDVASGVYTDSKDFMSKIGLNVEDFEMGELDPSLWTNDVSAPWTFNTQQPYEGNNCLRSGAISDNGETSLVLTFEVGEPDSIAFYYKVSSENTYDKMFFYIDNQEKSNWSGSVNWSRAQYPVTAGTHTFTWKYKKDYSVSSGEDCAWIDFVVLPRDLSLAGSAGLDVDVCYGEPAQILGYANNYESISWTTAGDGTFDDTTIANPVYTPGPTDLANGTVTLSITVSGSHGNVINDDMNVNIYHEVSVSMPTSFVAIEYCAVEEPQSIVVEVTGDYDSFTWSTSGDGTFEDATALETTYTPGPMDIENGVSLTATAHSPGCGPVSFDYPFEMNLAPSFTMGIIPPCAFDYCQGQDIEMPVDIEFAGFIDGLMTITINDENYPVVEGEPFLLPTATLEPGSHSAHFQHLSNGLCDIDIDSYFSFSILAAPNLTVEETSYEICQGESVSIELHTSGGDPGHPEAYHFTVSGEGVEPIEIIGESYTLTLTPAESTEIHLTRIAMENPSECGGDCSTDLDITLTLEVIPTDVAPVISGDTELDARLTPTSTYTIANDLKVAYTLEPDEAGTLTVSDDDKTIEVLWNQSYKGAVTLTATPLSECNDLVGSLNITVKNSTDVNETANSTKIYPNPTSEKVNIECIGMTHVTVFNAIGQMVYDAEVDTDKVTLNTETIPAGSYLVRITTNEGSFAKHLSVVK